MREKQLSLANKFAACHCSLVLILLTTVIHTMDLILEGILDFQMGLSRRNLSLLRKMSKKWKTWMTIPEERIDQILLSWKELHWEESRESKRSGLIWSENPIYIRILNRKKLHDVSNVNTTSYNKGGKGLRKGIFPYILKKMRYRNHHPSQKKKVIKRKHNLDR